MKALNRWCPSVRLSSVTAGRDNNLNAIRLVAAVAVLVSHSYPLINGVRSREPLHNLIGMSIGTVAVDAFFIISGFLNAQSLMRGTTARRFVVARALRIYPGLWVMLFATALALAMTNEMGLVAFFARPSTQSYVVRNALMVGGAVFEIAEAFPKVALAHVVNGSLWSLPIEIRLYVLLVTTWAALGVFGRRKDQLRSIFLGIVVLACGAYFLIGRNRGWPYQLEARLFFMFAQGSLWALAQRHVLLRADVFVVVLVSVCAVAKVSNIFYPIYFAGLGYVLLFLAYVPAGKVRAFNHIGDYSYGVYIYSFPIQQAVASILPNSSVLQMILVSLPLSMIVAVASWHLVEHPALRLRTRLTASA